MKNRVIRLLAAVALAHVSPAFSQTAAEQVELAFRLSEQAYPSYFPVETESAYGFQYRCYGASHFCLGAKDGNMYFYDGVTLQDVGTVDSVLGSLVGGSQTPVYRSSAPSSTATARSGDHVVFSFATVGDSREAEGAPWLNAQDAIWLQNTKVLARILREVGKEKPNAFFFNGDMIMGYKTDANILNRQYAYWRGMVATLMEQGTYVVPVPGNHEIQEKLSTGQKVAREVNEQTWRDNMGDLILDHSRWLATAGTDFSAWDVKNTPPIGGPDGILTDQSQLSYSFDVQNMHFAIINTDAVGNDSKAPVAWLAQDLAAAKSRGASRFFVFGHKMAYTYYAPTITKPDGLDVNPANQQAFWDLIETYGATYFCGHEHIFHASQPRGKAWQVLVGSGGTPFDLKPGASTNPDDYTYAWASVKVYQSGRVHVDVFGFDADMSLTRLVTGFDI